MSVLIDYLQTLIDDFRGAWLNIEASDVPKINALLSQNVSYLPGQVKKRFGFLPILTPGDAILALQDWLPHTFSDYTHLVAFLSSSGSHAGVSLYNFVTAAYQTLYTPASVPAAVGAFFAGNGPRLYISTFDVNGRGSDLGRVFSTPSLLSSIAATDKLFLPPTQAVPTMTVNTFGTPATPALTAGPHRFGYLVTYRDGHVTSPSPVDGGNNFKYQTFTADGVSTYLFHLNGALLPASVSGIQPIMTTTDNLSRFYAIPGTAFLLTGPSGFPSFFAVNINITDEDLAADGEDVTPLFNQITQTQVGTGPFSPSVIGEYNNRLFYVTIDASNLPVVYISEEDAYQQITADQHGVYLPGNRSITTAFVLYNTLYILGPHWTYSSQDTGDVPVLWPTPKLVDGAIGTLAPRGVTVNAGRGFAWIADVDGLYVFEGGSFSARPVSYYQKPDWARINWNVAGTLQIIDNKDTKQVKVLAALDSATTPSHILTWDYTRGLNPEDVNYSLDSLVNYPLGAIAVMQNDTTKRLETWIASSDQTKDIRREAASTDTTPYRDGTGDAIASTYQTSLLPKMTARILQHHGDHLRLQGSGVVDITVKTLDGGREIPLAVILEATAPAQLYIRKYHALSEAVSLTISNTGLDSYFILSQIIHYFSSWVMLR